jgi:hypothetical protein
MIDLEDTMGYFDYQSVAREAGLTDQQVEALRRLVLAEVPDDPMMSELRLLRVCMAIRDGHATVDEVLRQQVRAA